MSLLVLLTSGSGIKGSNSLMLKGKFWAAAVGEATECIFEAGRDVDSGFTMDLFYAAV